jgi:cullin 5
VQVSVVIVKFDRKSNKSQKRGKINLIGRLQLSTERSREEDNEGIVQLRILRVQVSWAQKLHLMLVTKMRRVNLQEAIIKILKMRKKITNAQLQTELVDILKNMFLPTKKMIKEQVEWLIEHKYLRRDDNDLNVFYYIS